MNNLTHATKTQYKDVIKQLQNTGEAKVVCVHNVDSDGYRQNLCIGSAYILKNYNHAEKEFDIYTENGMSVLNGFYVDDYDRYEFFKLYVESAAENAANKLIEAKRAAFEELDTDSLISSIKNLEKDLELIKEMVRARLQGVI